MENRLANKALEVSLVLNGWTGTSSDVDLSDKLCALQGADRESHKAIKSIVPRSMFKKLSIVRAKTRLTFNELTMPWTSKSRLCAIATVDYFRGQMEELFQAGTEEIINVTKEYSKFVESGKAREFLGESFDSSLYPSPEEFRKKFKSYLEFSVPGEVADFKLPGNEGLKELLDRTRLEAEESLNKEIVKRLASRLEKVSEAMVKYNQREEAGGKGRLGAFSDKTVESLKEIIDALPVLNVTDNKEIDYIISDLKSKFSFAPDVLRSDSDARELVISEARDTLDKLSAWL